MIVFWAVLILTVVNWAGVALNWRIQRSISRLLKASSADNRELANEIGSHHEVLKENLVFLRAIEARTRPADESGEEWRG